MRSNIRLGKIFALAAATLASGIVAASSPPEAAADAPWGSSVAFHCSSYGSGYRVGHSGRAYPYQPDYFRYWVKALPAGQWSAPSDWIPGSGTFEFFGSGARLQFYVEYARLFGTWAFHPEYGYVVQDRVALGYGATCRI